jgi:hypothetical protein
MSESRKIAAILVADVAGRLAGADVERTASSKASRRAGGQAPLC